MQPLFASSPARILGLALAYFAIARLGLLLAIPPGYATAIWPPSGLALAALLIWGYPMAIGVFLGSLAVNSYVTAPANGLGITAFYLPACIAAGSALQAVVGKYLVERYCSPPWNFIRLSQMLWLIGLGGPVASVISASVGSASLQGFGMLQPEAFADSWFTWWLGDSLGVLVFTPLVLLSYQDSELVNRRRKLTIVLPMLLAFFFIGYLYTVGKADVRQHIENRLKTEAGVADAFLQQLTSQKAGVLYATASFFRASQHVSRDEFHQFYDSMRANLSGLQALSWVPRISFAELPQWVDRARKEGYPDFELKEFSEHGLVSASARAHYQPIFHLAPLDGHRRAQGFDVLSEEIRRSGVENALKSGAMAVAGPVELVHSDEVERAYLLVLPVFPGAGQDVVIAVIWLENLISPFAQLRTDNAVEFRLSEQSTGELLYQSSTQSASTAGLKHVAVMPFFDHQWTLEVWLPDPAVARAMNDKLWPIIIGGFCIMGSLALLIINTTGAQAASNLLIEQKTAELEQERTFLETLIDHLPLVLYVKDAETRRYIRANRAAERILGEDRPDLINHTQEELFAEGMGYSSQEADDFVVLQKKVHREITRFVHKDETFWFTSSKIPIEDPVTGKVKYILGLAEDITAHRDAERSLEDSRQRISRILESVGEGIFGVDSGGHLTFFNQASADILGYKEMDVLGQNAHRLFHHHHRSGEPFPIEDCSIQQTLLTGKNYRIDDEVFWRNDGTAIPVEYVSTPIIEEHDVIGAVVVFSDISKRLVLERLQQEQTRRIEQVNQELEEFSYVASHDIQEPLRTLNCFCDFLEEDLGAELSERAATDLGYIKEASQRMSVLINDMLEYSRAGRTDMEVVPVNLDDCLAQINDDLQLLIRETGATLNLESLPKVMGDTNSLVRIFQNLIQNALKFCKERTPVVTVKTVSNDGRLATIVVEDNGIGIEERFIEQIFGAFRRLHNADDYPGSGIGLAVVKKLVERHNGRIWAESTPGQGSRFFVSLPVRRIDIA